MNHGTGTLSLLLTNGGKTGRLIDNGDKRIEGGLNRIFPGNSSIAVADLGQNYSTAA